VNDLKPLKRAMFDEKVGAVVLNVDKIVRSDGIVGDLN
jgi:hypothetical protein